MRFHLDGDKVRRWREERHWSQDHLASLAGVGTRTVQRVENGDPASNETVMALAAAFNVGVDALTIDPQSRAADAERANLDNKLAGFRLSLWIHIPAYLFVMLIFIAVTLTDNAPGFALLTPALWCTVALAGHALAVVIVTLMIRGSRRTGGAPSG